MIVSYFSSNNYNSLSATYLHDNDVDFQNKPVSIEGRLSVNASPVFYRLKDFKKNNYSLMYLTRPTQMSGLTDFYAPMNNNNIIIGKIFFKAANDIKFLKFDAAIDDQEILTINYDQSFNPVTTNEPVNIFHFIKKTPNICNIMYFYGNEEYYLNFNPVTFNINFTTLSGFNELRDYTRQFYYTYNDENGLFTLQCRIQGTAYRVIYNGSTNRFALSTVNQISLTDTRCLFYLTAAKNFDRPEITVDWGCYTRDFNQNSLAIDTARSFFNTKNSFLLHSEYLRFNNLSLPCNILSLKNQQNIKNISTRGNCFPQEEQVFSREYESIFSGGKQEQGFEKLHLQYSTYTFPYEFLPGKTTWFHTPQSMWPYLRLNINHTSLVDSGAVGGDHPLRSDKVFKKLGNYKTTANFGDSSSEQTGQWLCAWLSAGPNINVRPIWVDRFYNPTKFTPFQALTATPGSITYIPSYTTYMTTGIYDVPSSLTFEPGNLYAYTHLGTSDALENINALEAFIQAKNFTSYLRVDSKKLQPEQRKNITTYKFDGNSYGIIDVSNIKSDLNQFTLSFWASRQDWSQPCGFELAGNFTDYGLGIFNYELVTPLLMYTSLTNNSIYAYNSELELVNIYNLDSASNAIPYFIARRDPLNSFHIFTSLSSVFELNLQETIIDRASLPGNVTYVTNTENFAYLLFNTTTRIGKLNLLTNETSFTSATFVGVTSATAENTLITASSANRFNKIIAIDDNRLISLSTYKSSEPRCIGENIYYLSEYIDPNSLRRTISGGVLSVASWNTQLSTWISKVWNIPGTGSGDSYTIAGGGVNRIDAQLFAVNVQAALSSYTPKFYSYFNIDKNNNFWCVSGRSIEILNQYGSLSKTLSLDKSLTTYLTGAQILNIAYSDNFVDNKLQESIFISCSGDTPGKLFIFKIDSNGSILKSTTIDTYTFIDVDPSNYNYNFSRNFSKQDKYTFKIRLYNQFDTEDSIILKLKLNSSDINPGYHHFAITLDTLNGVATLYLDGEVYVKQSFEPNKYAFTPLTLDNLAIGSTCFYNNTLLNNFLSPNKTTNYYFVKDLEVQNFYWFNKIINYFDVNMLYKEKIEPNTLVWDIPSGRRFYNETISRYFRNTVPGAKSALVNIYINSASLDQSCKDVLEPELIQTINASLPGYAKLNKLIWTTNFVSLTAASQQPFFPGNTITNAGFSR